MIYAEFETRHFTFNAIAETVEAAIEAIEIAWYMHCDEYPAADRDYFSHDDVCWREMVVGAGYRDGEVMTRGATELQEELDNGNV